MSVGKDIFTTNGSAMNIYFNSGTASNPVTRAYGLQMRLNGLDYEVDGLIPYGRGVAGLPITTGRELSVWARFEGGKLYKLSALLPVIGDLTIPDSIRSDTEVRVNFSPPLMDGETIRLQFKRLNGALNEYQIVECSEVGVTECVIPRSTMSALVKKGDQFSLKASRLSELRFNSDFPGESSVISNAPVSNKNRIYAIQ